MCDCVVYNTPMNTIGVGDPVPFGINSYGSGDRFDTTPGSKSKNKNKKIYSKPPVQHGFNGIKQMPLIVMSNKIKEIRIPNSYLFLLLYIKFKIIYFICYICYIKTIFF